MTATLPARPVLDPTASHPTWCDEALHEAGPLDHRHISKPTVLVLEHDLPGDRAVITSSIEQYVEGGAGSWGAHAPGVRLLVNYGQKGDCGMGELDLTARDVMQLCRTLAGLHATIEAAG